MIMPDNPKEKWSSSDYMKRDLWVYHAHESKIEQRRSAAIWERVAILFYVGERRAAEIVAELGADKYQSPDEVYSPQTTEVGKIWTIIQEIYAGGYCRQVITCQGVYITHVEGGKTAAIEEMKRLEKKIKLWQQLAAL